MTLIQVLIINCIYNYICNSGLKNLELQIVCVLSRIHTHAIFDVCDIRFRSISNSFTNISNKLYLRHLRETCVLDKSKSII